jgi:RNA-splicing ligase RtcB
MKITQTFATMNRKAIMQVILEGLEITDESPMAYKNMDDIVRNIAPTAEIVNIIKPVYTFKAAK